MPSGVYERTEEHRKKMSEARKGIKNGMYGKLPWNKELTKEDHDSIRSHRKLKSMEEEYGKEKSEEIKRKISKGNKGKKRTEETKRKISEGSIGRKFSKVTRNKLSEACKGEKNHNFGKKLLEGTRKKISEAHKGRRLSIKTEFKKGVDNPNFNNYSSFEPYDENFNKEFKRKIRKRENQRCILCNIHREKLKRALDIHHIDYNKLNTTRENCISLCRNCHTKTNSNRKHWTKFFQGLLKEKYGYKY